MLRLLFQMFGAEIRSEIRFRANRAARAAAFMSVAAVFGFLGLALGLVAIAIALAPHLGAAGAAGAVAGGALVIAAITLWIGLSPPRRRVRARAVAPPPVAPLASGLPPPVQGQGPAFGTITTAALAAVLAGIVLGRRL